MKLEWFLDKQAKYYLEQYDNYNYRTLQKLQNGFELKNGFAYINIIPWKHAFDYHGVVFTLPCNRQIGRTEVHVMYQSDTWDKPTFTIKTMGNIYAVSGMIKSQIEDLNVLIRKMLSENAEQRRLDSITFHNERIIESQKALEKLQKDD